jgi:hypothetical protein
MMMSCQVGKPTPTLTPIERVHKFYRAWLEAVSDFDAARVVKMAAAVNWRWAGEPITEEMVRDMLLQAIEWALAAQDRKGWSQPVDIAGQYTAGFFIVISEEGDESGTDIYVAIVWGASGEGDSENIKCIGVME